MLPETIRSLIAVVGHAQTMSLVAEIGGQDFRWPAGKKSDVWEYLVEIVGPKSAERLIAQFGGTEMYIPLCSRAIAADRRRRIVTRYDELLRSGNSSRGAISILVREFRPISNRTIQTMVNKPMDDGIGAMETQGSLF